MVALGTEVNVDWFQIWESEIDRILFVVVESLVSFGRRKTFRCFDLLNECGCSFVFASVSLGDYKVEGREVVFGGDSINSWLRRCRLRWGMLEMGIVHLRSWP